MTTTSDSPTEVWGDTCPIALFRDRVPDWEAFADAKMPGYHRAQHRYIGAGASGKVADPQALPAGNFTLQHNVRARRRG